MIPFLKKPAPRWRVELYKTYRTDPLTHDEIMLDIPILVHSGNYRGKETGDVYKTLWKEKRPFMLTADTAEYIPLPATYMDKLLGYFCGRS